MKKNDKILNFIIFLIISAMLLIVLAITLDFLNITNYFSFSINYDWLGLIGAVVGGIIGAATTFLGIWYNLKIEKEENEKRLIDERKRVGYSYLTYSNEPLFITLHLDAKTSIGNIIGNYNILVDESADINYSNFCDIEFSFVNINNNYPSKAKIKNMVLLYNPIENKPEKSYKNLKDFKAYNPKFKSVTIKNENIIVFTSKVLISKKVLDQLEKELEKSKTIDIQAKIDFINPMGVITKGTFTANLIQDEVQTIKEEDVVGNSKLKIRYKAINTYFTIKEIDYIESQIDDQE